MITLKIQTIALRPSLITIAMKLLLLLLAILSSEGVLTAPVMEGEGPEGEGCSATNVLEELNETVPMQEELSELLKSALVNNTENDDRIKAAFTLQPDEVKLCVRVEYIITCSDKTNCVVADWDCTNNCSAAFVWTSFDPHSLSGSLLFHYASNEFELFGFEWGGACDLSLQNTLMC